MAFGFTEEQIRAWREAQGITNNTNTITTKRDVDVGAPDERPTDEQLIKDALRAMRHFNQALAAVARRGYGIGLNVEQPSVVRRRLQGKKTHDSPLEYDAVFVRPALVTANEPKKVKP